MTQHCDTWHQLEAADERAWLDAWTRAQNTKTAADPTPEFYGRKTAPATQEPTRDSLTRV